MFQGKNAKLLAGASLAAVVICVAIVAFSAATNAQAVTTPFVAPVETPAPSIWGTHSKDLLDALDVPADGYAYVLNTSKHISITTKTVREWKFAGIELYTINTNDEIQFNVKHDLSKEPGSWGFTIVSRGRYMLLDKANGTTIFVVGKEPSTGSVQFQESLKEMRDLRPEEKALEKSPPEVKQAREARIIDFWQAIDLYQQEGNTVTALIDADTMRLVGTWKGKLPVGKDDAVPDCYSDSIDAAGIKAGAILFVALDREYAKKVLKDYEDLLGGDLENIPNLCK